MIWYSDTIAMPQITEIKTSSIHEIPTNEAVRGLVERGSFPVFTGDFRALDTFSGSVVSTTGGPGLRKPAREHHRNAVVTDATGSDIEIHDLATGAQLVVTAKGTNMTRPRIGVTTGELGRPYGYTYGLMDRHETGAQSRYAERLTSSGMAAERLLGGMAVEEYLVGGRVLSPEEFSSHALAEYEAKLAGLKSMKEKPDKRLAVARNYVGGGHSIVLRGMESALRLADLQDAPELHSPEAFSRVPASAETIEVPKDAAEYMEWMQSRLGTNIKRMHQADLVHGVLYHGGNMTTNGEIVDLTTLRGRELMRSDTAFEDAAAKDVADAARNVEQTQTALGLTPDSRLFLDRVRK